MKKGGSAGWPDVFVVGGGVIGLSVADRLASEGLSVGLLEAETPGAGASGAAAGMLAPFSEALPDAAAVERDRLGLACASLGQFPALCARLREETGLDPELEASGTLHVARGEEEARRLERWRARLEACDAGPAASAESLDRAALRSLDAGFAGDVEAGLWLPGEAHLRPPVLVRALAASLRSRGVSIETGVRVHALRRESDGARLETSAGPRHAGHVVLAAGAWSTALWSAESAAPGLEIEPVRGQILSLEPPLPAAKPMIWSSEVYHVPKRDGAWVVGATEERVGFDARVTAAGIAGLVDAARRVFPELGRAGFGRAWAGLRPVSRDGSPWIGPWPEVPQWLVASGHGRNGVLLAPITAELVARELLGKAWPAAALAWRPSARANGG